MSITETRTQRHERERKEARSRPLRRRRESATVTKAKWTGSAWLIETGHMGFGIGEASGLSVEQLRALDVRKGDVATVVTVLGSSVVRIALRGREVFNLTDEEFWHQRDREQEEHERKREEDFRRERADLDARFEALPPEFKQRIERFRENNPDFRQQYESYEMFCCTEAVRIARGVERHVGDGAYEDEVAAFWADEEKRKLAAYPRDEAWEEPRSPHLRFLFWWEALGSKAYGYDLKREKEVIPYDDGHSGNTFGAACMLARLYLEDASLVPKMHGAMSPVVGSEEHGDLSAEEQERRERERTVEEARDCPR